MTEPTETKINKELPPKPTVPLNAQLKIALLQARLSAILPLIFLICAMGVLAASFKYPDIAEKVAAGNAVTGLLTTAAALAKGTN